MKQYYIDLDIYNSEILECKKCGRTFSRNIGNFCKHIFSHEMDMHEYNVKYYPNDIPKCLESGNYSDWKIPGYNRYILFQKKYKILHRDLIIKENIIEKIKEKTPEFYTQYLNTDYWLTNGKKPSWIIKFYKFILSSDKKLYKRLADSFYDECWTEIGKRNYVNSLLNMNFIQIPAIYSVIGWKFRGWENPVEARLNWIKNKNIKFNTCFSPEFNKEMNKRCVEKYNTKEKQREKSIRCIEYWIKKDYTKEEAQIIVNDIQTNNSLSKIAKFHNCDLHRAKEIQRKIYDARLLTFSKKSLEELKEIWSRQDSGSLNYCIKKCNFDYEKALELFNSLKEKRTVPFGKASKESLKYFIPLYKFLRRNGIYREDIRLGVSGSNEYFLKGDKFYMYDFTIISKKIIIEYDGIHWHSEPKKDVDKQKFAEDRGFSVLRLSSEETKQNNFNKINNFLYEKLRIRNTDW